jgi:uncharacterized iron-regulated protein
MYPGGDMQLILGLLAIYSMNANSMNVNDDYREMIWDSREKAWLSLDQIQPRFHNEIFVLGEEHATTDNAADPLTRLHHANQLRLIEQLKKHERVSVGMEFISYPFQPETDRFVAGEYAEADFLKTIGWGLSPFEFYRDQVLASRGSGRTLALNAPRELTRRVGQVGPNGLSQDERSLLPPIWERGGDEYFERFQETMREHVPPEKIENYFWAHSLWDDTMAWKAMARLDGSVLAIIVGEFHAEFGHGLPSRLRRHGASHVTTVIQVPIDDFSENELRKAIAPDPQYGDRADLLWVYSSLHSRQRVTGPKRQLWKELTWFFN